MSDLMFRTLAEALDAIARVACIPGEDMRFIRTGREWYVYHDEDEADEDDTGAGALAVVERFAVNVMLSSADLGDANADDFSAWIDYVTEHLDGKLELFCDVDASRFGAAGPDVIHVEGIERSEVREAIGCLWEAFCEERPVNAGESLVVTWRNGQGTEETASAETLEQLRDELASRGYAGPSMNVAGVGWVNATSYRYA